MALMVSTAEKFGGVCVMALMYRTQFEVEFEKLQKLIANRTDAFNKLFGGDQLRKMAGADLGELQKIAAGLREIHTTTDEALALYRHCRELLPDFEAHVHNRPFVAAAPTGTVRDYGGSGLLLVGKDADAYADLGEALKAGAVQPLQTQPQQPAIDPSANVTDAMLQHRRF